MIKQLRQWRKLLPMVIVLIDSKSMLVNIMLIYSSCVIYSLFQDFDIKHKCACPGECVGVGGGGGGVEAGIVGIVFMLL